MTLQHIQLVTILLWGYQADLILFAIPMAIILEARFYLKIRWALTKQDFYRTADLTTLGVVAVITFLFVNRAEYHFITTLVQWLPIVFFPLVTVIAYSTSERMPLDVLFYSLRRQREPVTQSWDMNYLFFGMCLVAAGTNPRQGIYYLLVAGTLVMIALYRLRSPRYATNVWLLAALIIFFAANMTQQGLRGGHLAIKETTRAWIAEFVRNRTNPLKTKSSIGFVGQMKLSDSILFRVEPLTGAAAPRLLQEASYDSPSENDWVVLNPQFESVPHADDFRWRLAEPGAEERAKIYIEFSREIGIVPVPQNVTEIFDLPAVDIKKSRFGSIQGVGMVPSPGYEISYRQGESINSIPDRSDLYVPTEYLPVLSTFEEVTDETNPLKKVHAIFRDFRYSLYQDIAPNDEPIVDFLTRTRAGHCEYFASATVLLLRQFGVPARYVVGYSVQEYNDTIDMYVVRERHAHAWAIAWIDGAWQVVDTTPQLWVEAEARQAGFMRPLQDLLANTAFVIQVWWSKQKLEDYERELYILGAILALVLIWRIATSEQVMLKDEEDDDITSNFDRQGLDSPFYRIEEELSRLGLDRQRGELFSHWLARVGHDELVPMLSLHNRIRFDPRGVEPKEVDSLAGEVDEWLRSREADSAVG